MFGFQKIRGKMQRKENKKEKKEVKVNNFFLLIQTHFIYFNS